jgi:hypothetical protein
MSRLLVDQSFHTAERIFKGFQIAAVVRASIDLIRIPILYLAAWWLKVDLPFKLSHAGLLVYAVIIFVLTVAALATPVFIASILGLAASTLGLGSSFYYFGKLLYDTHQTRKRFTQLEGEIDQAIADCESSEDEAKLLLETKSEESEYLAKINQLDEVYENDGKRLQALLDEKRSLEEFWNTELGLRSSIDKIIGMSLALASFAGTIVCFFNPLAGLIVLSIAALATGAYLIASVSITLITYLIEQKKSENNSSSTLEEDFGSFVGAMLGFEKSNELKPSLDYDDSKGYLPLYLKQPEGEMTQEMTYEPTLQP